MWVSLNIFFSIYKNVNRMLSKKKKSFQKGLWKVPKSFWRRKNILENQKQGLVEYINSYFILWKEILTASGYSVGWRFFSISILWSSIWNIKNSKILKIFMSIKSLVTMKNILNFFLNCFKLLHLSLLLSYDKVDGK